MNYNGFTNVVIFFLGMSVDSKIPESPPDLDYSTESTGSKLARKTKDNPMMTIGK